MHTTLDLRPIVVDGPTLDQATTRDPFDQLAEEMLARAGMMSDQLIASAQRATPAVGMNLDQAVIGGLLVRMAKLIRGMFDATQIDESEAHLILSRCAAETAITLTWLVRHGDSQSLRRFRADSFAHWRGEFERMDSVDSDEDDTGATIRERVKQHIEAELKAAGVTWADVPRRTNSWGPDTRQRCAQLGLEWVYTALFAAHSSYVHPSWHELRAFHLKTGSETLILDPTFGGMAPSVGYVLARLVTEACQAAAEAIPCDLDDADLRTRVKNTVEASQVLALYFSDYMARCGLDDSFSPSTTLPSNPAD